ncbi:conserved hypothetical protein [Burkholderia sp. H160]|nr:conserved hypothetical protein [Burkholderia sp. H160]
MTVYLEEFSEGNPTIFERVSLSSSDGHNERWLQERLFKHPNLIPMVEMFGHGEAFIPLCRELPLRHGSSNVFLDLLGVSPTGRLVLVECKLWRNPEARREVVAQIFEYAALLAEWTYSDLEARLKQARRLTGENPIFQAVRAADPNCDEARFVDGVNASLSRGDFLLAIAGDGIRSDLHALRRLMASQGGLLSKLALLEIKIFKDASGRALLVPNVPVQTEIVKREVLVRADGESLEKTGQAVPRDQPVLRTLEHAATSNDARLQNRAFWDKFISLVKFDHPDQTTPRHGGNNWVRIELPGPIKGLVAYRTAAGEAGFMVKFLGADGRDVLRSLLDDQPALEQELGQSVRFDIGEPGEESADVVGQMLVDYVPSSDSNSQDSSQLSWLVATANSIVTALRPRLK